MRKLKTSLRKIRRITGKCHSIFVSSSSVESSAAGFVASSLVACIVPNYTIVYTCSTVMASPIESILKKVVEGDEKAFAQLYNKYRKPTLRFCTSILKDEDEAENMLHEVFIKIWERRAQINPERNFHSYLFTCLRNMAFDYLKEMDKNHQLRQQYLERMESYREDDREEEEKQLARLRQAVNGLSEKRKRILLLSVHEGRSYQEIAEMLRISKNTVKNQLVKAKHLLRERMSVQAV